MVISSWIINEQASKFCLKWFFVIVFCLFVFWYKFRNLKFLFATTYIFMHKYTCTCTPLPIKHWMNGVDWYISNRNMTNFQSKLGTKYSWKGMKFAICVPIQQLHYRCYENFSEFWRWFCLFTNITCKNLARFHCWLSWYTSQLHHNIYTVFYKMVYILLIS